MTTDKIRELEHECDLAHDAMHTAIEALLPADRWVDPAEHPEAVLALRRKYEAACLALRLECKREQPLVSDLGK